MRKFIPFLIGSTVYCQEKNNFFTTKEINHKFKNVYQIDGQQTIHLLSILRNKDTDMIKFRQITDRLTRILLETGLSLLEKVTKEKQTPLDKYTSKEIKCDEQDICIVSILRSGNTFLNSCLQVLPKATIGQILVQRHQETHKPIQYYESLPSDLSNKQIFLVDPMIATGGSAKQVLEILIKHGAQQPNITFLNIVSCEVGIKSIQQEYPNIKIITVSLDPVLTPNCYLSPGLGDYGDRYFGTQ